MRPHAKMILSTFRDIFVIVNTVNPLTIGSSLADNTVCKKAAMTAENVTVLVIIMAGKNSHHFSPTVPIANASLSLPTAFPNTPNNTDDGDPKHIKTISLNQSMDDSTASMATLAKTMH